MSDDFDWAARRSRLIPPVYFFGAIVAMAALWLLTDLRTGFTPPVRIALLLLLAVGVGIAVWGAVTFRRAGTALHPFERSSALVTGGPFRFTRNPMYLGMVLALAGVAGALDATLAWAVVAGFAVFIDRHFIRHEERMQLDIFGDEYAAYRERVRRWI